jgi:hypothetical protein
MSFDLLNTLDVIEVMENFIFRIRPEEEIRDKIDVAYKIEDQSIIIYEIFPLYLESDKKTESPIAKTTYVKAKDHWKVFWLRGNLKWYSYDPKPTVKTLKEFTELVEEDPVGCFWG